MAQTSDPRLTDARARRRAEVLARRRRVRTRLPLDAALRIALDPGTDRSLRA
ncbi:hypothetical protein CHO01_39020 [Cellulomonas hominis]|jgi:hypothetical protein|uniref:Uncharacterized protein n=1 Tax=Cellulomonas hominis TaxID=156981 RepID=A0A511FHR6_9CELL|nr:hypothetical protein [Cellulomonas hominis]MBB5475145.1 hypothetical protein [Cellulomonas hominis]NKY10707.1 hypothetical protein [Cellulomonas hominis]GEL48786.1 hypothetical protein CHO01_39020 [Cellulomonas hominis]